MTDRTNEAVLAAARRWADFFETLTPETLDRIGAQCRTDVRFKDPFNDVSGIEAVRAVFEHMFATVDSPVFKVSDIALSGQTAYLRWIFYFVPKGGNPEPWTISGVSEVLFDDNLKVVSHIDHWDASEQFYARLPFLGRIIRWVRSKVSA